MFKHTITSLDFNGKEKTADYYFNLTKGEIAKIHLALPGGLDGFLEHLKTDPDVNSIINVFEMLILRSYGKRTADDKFIKSKELSEEFAATDAYSELFLEFIDNKDDFVNKFLEGTVNVPLDTIQKIIAESNTPDLHDVFPEAL